MSGPKGHPIEAPYRGLKAPSPSVLSYLQPVWTSNGSMS
jgi:hypothetical protein